MSRRLRVAVAGLGVGRAHVWAYQQLADRFEVVAVCDPDPEKRSQAQKRQAVPRAFATLEELLDLDALDVVSICTPPHLHLEHCRAALATGRHVVCEKPLVGSLADCDALVAAEEASAGRLMPIFQYRFGAGIQKLTHLVGDGVCGRAYVSTLETAWFRDQSYYAAPWRGRWETEGGGVLLCHAVHVHDLLTLVLGPADRVFARVTTRVNRIETEDCAVATFQMADGSIATSAATLGSHREISRLRFCFEHLTAESSLAPYDPGADPWTFTPADETVRDAIEASLRGFESGAGGYVGQFERLGRALSDGGDLPVTLADARASLELVTALYHSSDTGEAVSLPLAPDHPKYRGWGPRR